MSIIQEALKKAEGSGPKIESSPIPAVKPAGTPVKEGRPAVALKTKAAAKKSVSPIFIFAPIAFAVITVTAFFVFNNRFLPAKEPAPERSSAAVAAPAAPPALTDIPSPSRQEIVSKVPPKDTPRFILNGIMYIESGPKAIVNGSVVEEGDVIGGATVKKINKGDVLLGYEDADILLDLND